MAPKVDKGKRKVGETSGRKKKKPYQWEAPPGFIVYHPDERAAYENIANRPIKPTRYMDLTAMAKLGIRDDCVWLLNNAGLFEFMNMQLPTYESLTFEFLTTFSWSADGTVRFQVGGQRKAVPLQAFMEHFHIPMDGVTEPAHCETYNANAFWTAITGDTEAYYPRNAKASRIQHPAFRYLHRVIAHTIFARGDSDGNVQQNELFLLWAMTERRRVNIAPFFLRHLQEVKLSDSGAICIGGFATSLADAYAVDMTGQKQVLGPIKDDLSTCKSMRMITRAGTRFRLTIKGNVKSIHLPHPNISVQNQANWLVENVPDVAENVDEEIVHSDPDQADYIHQQQGYQQQGQGGGYTGYSRRELDDAFWNIDGYLRESDDYHRQHETMLQQQSQLLQTQGQLIQQQGALLQAFGTELQTQRQTLNTMHVAYNTQGQHLVNQGQKFTAMEQMLQQIHELHFPPPPPPPPF